MWQRALESNLNPSDPNGPLPFTSTGLLSIAYCRVYFDLGPFRDLEPLEPWKTCQSLTRLPSVPRENDVLLAIAHSTYGLGLYVKLGISYISHSTLLCWSLQHALSAFESAILQIKWLLTIGNTINSQPLNGMQNSFDYLLVIKKRS